MLSPRPIAMFVLVFVLTYAVLLALWPGINTAYRAFYCAMGNALFSSVGSDGSAHFTAAASKGDYDISLTLRNKKAPRTVGEMGQNSRNIGYMPTVSALALILGTPLPWSRRLRALLWGLLLVHGFVVARMGLPIILEFSRDSPLRVFELGPLAQSILQRALPALLHAPASFFVVPIFIWILVTFRKSDFDRWQHVAVSERRVKDSRKRSPNPTDTP